MPPAFIVFGLDALHIVIYGEAVAIVALLLFIRLLWVAFDRVDRRIERAERERDEARDTLGVLRRMSEIRVETVIRMKGFT